MIFQTIKTKEFGEVPIIGYVNSSTEKVHFYQEDEELSNLRPKQAQNEDLLSKVAIKKQGSHQKDNSKSLFSKL